MKRKIISKIILGTLLILLAVTGLCYGAYRLWLEPHHATVKSFDTSLPLKTELTREQAAEDLTYVMDHFARYHPAWVDGSDVSAVEDRYDAEIEGLGERVTVSDLWKAAARIMASLHDAHSSIGYNPDEKRYIDSFEWADAYEVDAINGVPTEELYETFLTRCSYELTSFARYQFDNAILREDYLRRMGFDTSEGVDFTYRTEAGDKTVHHTFVPLDQTAGFTGDTDADEFVSYTIDEEAGLAVLTLDECHYNDHYLQVLNTFFADITEKSIHNVAVDLRSNGGGNSRVIQGFLQYVDVDRFSTFGGVDVRMGPILWRNKASVTVNRKKPNPFAGRLYVLTSAGTFSSAMDFAVTIHDNHIGTVIGEIPGNMPTCYGDILRFQTPHARLPFTVSYKRFHRVDRTLDSEPLIPDYEAAAEDAMDTLYGVIGE